MSTFHNSLWLGRSFLATALVICAGGVSAQQSATADRFGFGAPATAEEVAAWAIAYPPDGAGLPEGSGAYEKGKEIFASSCAYCHGADLKGVKDENLPQNGGPALVGGRGSLNTDKPLQTVESYWPYATTLYDYIYRAMPLTAPASLEADEVYSLVAYILGEASIIDKTEVVDAGTLPRIEMPNREGFFLDDRPWPVQPYSDPRFQPLNTERGQ